MVRDLIGRKIINQRVTTNKQWVELTLDDGYCIYVEAKELEV